MNRFILLHVIFLISVTFGKTQPIHFHSNDYEKTFSRPLVVEILEEDPNVIKKLEKASQKYPNSINDYRNFISSYNQFIKKAIDKCWVINKKIIYKNTSEIKSLIAAKDTNYVCLYYSESGKAFFDYTSHLYLKVPTLNYTRIEHHNKKIDYAVYLPVSFLRPDDVYLETDLLFALQHIQINLDYNKINEKNLNSYAFAQHQALRTKDLESKTLLLDEVLSKDTTTFMEIKKHYKYNLKFVKPEEIKGAALKLDEKYAYLISMPSSVSSGESGFESGVNCMRVIVDAANGNILSSLGTHVDEANEYLFVDHDFDIVEHKKK